MNKFLFILLAFTFGSNDIAKINSLKKEAAQAYQNENYELAAEKYSYLVDSMEIMDDQILLNLANAYVHLNDSANAKSTYNKVVPTSNKKAKSVAYQQLGVLNDQPDNLEVALNYFKEALKADPTNKDARYNYEVVKKKLEKKKEQQEQQQNQDQNQENQEQQDKEQQQNENQENQDQKQDGENEDQQEGNQDEQKQNQQEDGEQQDSEQKEGENQEGEQQEGENQEGEEKKEGEQQEGEEQEGEEKEGEQSEQDQDGEKSEEQKLKELREKLKELNISPEKANNIFESYGNKEIQYLHQLKKRNTKPRDKTKPDW